MNKHFKILCGSLWFLWNANRTSEWKFVTEVTMFSRYGYEIENRDALGRYTSATYGYNNSLPTVVSSNARYREIGFAGFEDKDVNTCGYEHFGFGKNNVVNTQGHTGKHSLQVYRGTPEILERDLILCNEIKK